ncbi:MAG: hypothetical protein D4R64_02715 [Porphyromonadaceae bacterium]|nr:MAG: hypothetical protein D4R64_02715 [Porphyromonadaceae bacterium]
MYSNWKPYKHPLYGNIEIGGWSKFNSRLPQPFMLMDLVHRNAMAVFVSAFNLPQISLEVFEKKKIGKNLYRIKVRLANSKAVSSITYQSVHLKINPMDYLKLDGKNIRVVAGPEIQFFQIPSFGQVEYHSEKATDTTKEIEL